MKITLRDKFAMAALPAIIANFEAARDLDQGENDTELLPRAAEYAYNYADAMLIARDIEDVEF